MRDTPDLYENYIEFKGWDQKEAESRPEDFVALLAAAGMPRPASVLDIGFGRGEFLKWAKSREIETFGSEIILQLRQQAEEAGHSVINLEDYKGEFPLVTALDVLEHLTLDQLLAMLRDVRRLLTRDGRFVARFPNGQSPFSLPFQNGDMTHLRALTPTSLKQVAALCGLRIVSASNPRSKPPGLKAIKRAASYLLRDIVEIIIGYAYFGYRMPMDPNVVVVFARSDAA